MLKLRSRIFGTRQSTPFRGQPPPPKKKNG